MIHDWLEHVLRGVGDSLSDATQRWRTANRFGCLFTFSAAAGLLWIVVAAVGGVQFEPGGWWVCGGFAVVGTLAAAVCFWLGTRPEE